ncbi:hypothetical protein RCL1_000514 [Eukaryota sp. TZLM3-RCL]
MTLTSYSSLLKTFVVLLSHSAILNSLTSIYVPRTVSVLFRGEAKFLGFILAGGTIVQASSVFVALVSDRTQFKLGRRRPFIIIGTIVATAGILAIISIDSLLVLSPHTPVLLLRFLFIVGFLSTVFGGSLIHMHTIALISDLSSKLHFGKASGVQSLFFTSGTTIAFVSFSFRMHPFWHFSAVYSAFLVVLLCTATVTCLSAKETPFVRSPGQSLRLLHIIRDLKFNCRQHSDFTLIIIIKFIASCSAGIQTYFQYFLRDVLHEPQPDVVVARLGLINLTVGLIVSIPAGALCDVFPKKRILAVGTVLIGFCMVIMFYTTKIWHMVFVCIFFSLGLNSMQPADMSLTLSVIPKRDKSGSYLAMASLVLVCGVSCGSLLMSVIISFFVDYQHSDVVERYTVSGYRAIIICGFVCNCIATILTCYLSTEPVKGEKLVKREENEELLVYSDLN